MHEDILLIAETVEVVDAKTVLIAGKERTLSGHKASPAADHTWLQGVQSPLAGPQSTLGELIYRHCYVRPSPRIQASLEPWSGRAFESALTRSNSGHGMWVPDWGLEGEPCDGTAIVSWSGVKFWVATSRIRISGPTGQPGQECAVRVAKENRRLLPGFYLMVGNTEWDRFSSEGEPVIRLYWHLRSAGGPLFVAEVSQWLNAADVPFHAKVLSNPDTYQRADAGVLYLPGRCYPVAKDLVTRIYDRLIPHIADGQPFFTKRLAPGLGLAEDPQNGLSFGQHRCWLVGRGLWTSHENGGKTVAQRLDAIAEVLRTEGIDPEFPYLSSGSIDAYGFVSTRSMKAHTSRQEDRAPSPRPRSTTRYGDAAIDSSFLSASIRIGQEICASAYWDSDHSCCTWLGRSNIKLLSPADSTMPATATLASDFYDGVAGIAMYLSELFQRTGEEAFRRTALGAINYALKLESRSKASSSVGLSFYTGRTGVIYAAWRVRTQCAENPDSANLKALLENAILARQNQPDNDLLGGKAGAVLALLPLAKQTGWTECLSWAITLGEELAESMDLYGYRAFDHPSASGAQILSGMSHGAAGQGIALLALYAKTGSGTFLEAGRAALDFESQLFDSGEANWVDLRPSPPGWADGDNRRFSVLWCHGAPGIALSRLRASRTDPGRGDGYERHARVALATTQQSLAQKLSLQTHDISCCHGLTGLIEALWVGGALLREADYLESAQSATRLLLGAQASDLRSGTTCGGHNPSFMLGSSGFAYQLLRMQDPVTIPTLLVGPWHPGT